MWTYLSICALVPVAPLLATRREELVRYAKGLTLLCLPCFAIFLLFPVEGPRPEIAPDDAAYRWLVGVDDSANSFPRSARDPASTASSTATRCSGALPDSFPTGKYLLSVY